MQENDWINEAVKEFRKGCKELQEELSKADNGLLVYLPAYSGVL